MAEDASQLAQKWDLANHKSICGQTFARIHDSIEFFHRRHYCQYIPSVGPNQYEFPLRLNQWLENVTDDNDKRLMFEFVPKITFFGIEEFTKLHQAAFRGPISRWLITSMGLDLSDSSTPQIMQRELRSHTWYCPVTDSMPISDFHHANDLGGTDDRPQFRSLAKFGDSALVHKFMHGRTPLRRIVLLEDFVGAGTQIETAMEFAATIDPSIPVLFTPLIICPRGAETARRIASKHDNLSYEAVLELRANDFINPQSALQPGSLKDEIRKLASRSYPLVVGDNAADPRPYYPYGFRQTGAFVTFYSNTPANSLPMIHHESNTWKPLFRRSARIR